ncbi:hypothetical protein BDV93DRAFT_509725 [Ceratobasidium sp. AG-I]|nr:hypothetical protein BDV93DRAFT_509725 [Ceratobasidium sp. AG-I]
MPVKSQTTNKKAYSELQIKQPKDYEYNWDEDDVHYKQGLPSSPSRTARRRRSNDVSPTPHRTLREDSGLDARGWAQSSQRGKRDLGSRYRAPSAVLSGPALYATSPSSPVANLARPARRPLHDKTNIPPPPSTPARPPPPQTHLRTPESAPRGYKTRPPPKQVPPSSVSSLPRPGPSGSTGSSSIQYFSLPTPRSTSVRRRSQHTTYGKSSTETKHQFDDLKTRGSYRYQNTSHAGTFLVEQRTPRPTRELARDDKLLCPALTQKPPYPQCTRDARGRHGELPEFCWQHAKMLSQGKLVRVVSKSREENSVESNTEIAGRSSRRPEQDPREPQTYGSNLNKDIITQELRKRSPRQSARIKQDSVTNYDKFYDQKEPHDWREYIPTSLSAKTRHDLWVEMQKPVGDANIGYIYAYEILSRSKPYTSRIWFEVPLTVASVDKNTKTHIYMKVGYSNNPVKRMGEWERQCKSNEIVLRGVWPKREGSGNELTPNSKDWGKPSRYCTRLERLISLELRDVARHSPHLYDGKLLKPAVLESTVPCSSPKCRKRHREIYAIGRPCYEDEREVLEVIDAVVQSQIIYTSNIIVMRDDASRLVSNSGGKEPRKSLYRGDLPLPRFKKIAYISAF